MKFLSRLFRIFKNDRTKETKPRLELNYFEQVQEVEIERINVRRARNGRGPVRPR